MTEQTEISDEEMQLIIEKNALKSAENTYNEEILDLVSIGQLELNCGHEYMIRQLQDENISLKNRIEILEQKIKLIMEYLNLNNKEK